MKKQDVLDQFQSLLVECPEATTAPVEYRFLIGYEVDNVVPNTPRYRDIVLIVSNQVPENQIRLVKMIGVRYL